MTQACSCCGSVVKELQMEVSALRDIVMQQQQHTKDLEEVLAFFIVFINKLRNLVN